MERFVFKEPVTLVGAGALHPESLALAVELAPTIIAADSAADHLAALGYTPHAIIGDMDSIADPSKWENLPQTTFFRVEEQDTTDFEKCLYATEAPLYIACGFTGGRTDHFLACLHGLLARPEKRVALVDGNDSMMFLPANKSIEFTLQPGARVSLMPLSPSRCLMAEGLQWPVEGQELAPGTLVGVSNRCTTGQIKLKFDRCGILMITEESLLQQLIAAMR
jgi:thiamine pyrophosphokinase